MSKPERPSPRSQSVLLLGQDRRGHWVVQDRERKCGGVFFNRADALKFALFDHANRPQAVIFVPGILDLDPPKGLKP
jgi:hypothetical protein